MITADGELERAIEGQAVTLTLDDEIDASRGDVIAAGHNPPEVADQFAAHLLWLDDDRLLPGRPYWIKIGSRTVGAQITEIKHKVDVNTQDELAAKHLELNRSEEHTSELQSLIRLSSAVLRSQTKPYSINTTTDQRSTRSTQ